MMDVSAVQVDELMKPKHHRRPRVAHGIRPALPRQDIPRRERFAWRAKIHANPPLSAVYRVIIAIIGVIFIIAAGLTGWLPGPGGIPLFLAGMAILATEFRWAHRFTVVFASWLRKMSAWPRRTKQLVTAAFFLAIITGCYLALLIFGIPGWFPQWLIRLLQVLPGL